MGDKIFDRLGNAMTRLGKRMEKAGDDLSRDADRVMREADTIFANVGDGLFRTTTTTVKKTTIKRPTKPAAPKAKPAPAAEKKPDKLYLLVANERPVQGFWTLPEAEAAVRELQDLFAKVTKEGGESWKIICDKYPTTFFVNAPYFAQVGYVTVRIK